MGENKAPPSVTFEGCQLTVTVSTPNLCRPRFLLCFVGYVRKILIGGWGLCLA
jgi:hypothetical protein